MKVGFTKAGLQTINQVDVLSTFCVQFACNSYGNYAHNGRYRHFSALTVNKIDTIDVISPCRQQTVQLLIRRLCVRVAPGALTTLLFIGVFFCKQIRGAKYPSVVTKPYQMVGRNRRYNKKLACHYCSK